MMVKENVLMNVQHQTVISLMNLNLGIIHLIVLIVQVMIVFIARKACLFLMYV